MDNFIAPIIGVLLAVFIGWVESRGKKAGKTTGTASAGKNSPVTPRQQTREVVVVPPMKTYTSPYDPERLADMKKFEEEVHHFAEGQRVTSDPPVEVAPTEAARSGIRPPDIDGLRNAVIWSEILRRKF